MLGQELVGEFVAHKYEVFGWDKEELDITDYIVTASKISDLHPDIVINAVAYNAVDKIEEDEGAFELAKKIKKPAIIVTVLPDSGIKYLSKFFNDEWMRVNGFL